MKIIFLLCCTVSVYTQSLFESDSILRIDITGQLKPLLNDRTGIPRDFPFILHVENTDIPLLIKTRGHFRRTQGNCTYPPLLLQFNDREKTKSTVFDKQKKLKLVMPCQGDEYIIHEYLVYKLYQKFSPYSFKARLVLVYLHDTNSDKDRKPFYGLLLEDEDDMAARNNMVIVERKIPQQQIPAPQYHTMSVFEYMIGNTDWSVAYLQNIKLIAKDSVSIPYVVPYDFDHAGIVRAPYALPAPELNMFSTRERRYRGYCQPVQTVFDNVLKTFSALKEDVYKVYTDNKLLSPKYIKSTTDFLDQFYSTIADSKKIHKEFAYPCDPNGTGNVVIKGLKQ